MSNKKNIIRESILRLEQQRSQALSDLLDIRVMMRGSYGVVYTKCGKENCRCKKDKGHPHPRISWTENGIGVTRKVPQENIPWVQQVTESYRRFRKLRRRLVELESQIKELLDARQNRVIETTRNRKAFMTPKPQNRSSSLEEVPKKGNAKKRTPP